MIRLYLDIDFPFLYGMLDEEGLLAEDMGFEDNETWVYEDGEVKGFYTWEIQHNVFPHLKHFCVDGKSRGGAIARALIRHFKNRMKDMGYAKAILHAKTDFVAAVISRYFKTKPYNEKDGLRFFMCEV